MKPKIEARSLAEQYLDLIHPDPVEGIILPAGSIAEHSHHRSGIYGEDDDSETQSVVPWYGLAGQHGLDGSKGSIFRLLSQNLILPGAKQGYSREIAVEQVTLNRFRGVDNGRRRRAL